MKRTASAIIGALLILVIIAILLFTTALSRQQQYAKPRQGRGMGLRGGGGDDPAALSASVSGLLKRLDHLRSPLAGLAKKLPEEGEKSDAQLDEPKTDLRREADHGIHRDYTYHHNSHYRGEEETIFISVASFRDKECSATLNDIFAKAWKPANVYIGVVEQYLPEDKPCVDPAHALCNQSRFCPTDQIRIRRVKATEAKGPTGARHLASLMYRGETYFMMIDSHNVFVKYWDRKLIRSYKRALALSPKPVLSHYPEARDEKPIDNRPTTTFMCGAKFVNNYLRFDGIVTYRTDNPRLQPYAAAGFLFARGSLLKEVPFDPHIPFLFDGEEFLYTVRMYTHGWDIFSPNENVMYHHYYREGAPKFWSLNWHGPQQESIKRVQYITGTLKDGVAVPDHLTKETEHFGLGTVRTMADYWAFAQIDPKSGKVENNWCKKADVSKRVDAAFDNDIKELGETPNQLVR